MKKNSLFIVQELNLLLGRGLHNHGGKGKGEAVALHSIIFSSQVFGKITRCGPENCDFSLLFYLQQTFTFLILSLVLITFSVCAHPSVHESCQPSSNSHNHDTFSIPQILEHETLLRRRGVELTRPTRIGIFLWWIMRRGCKLTL